jgi:hypothetical protein
MQVARIYTTLVHGCSTILYQTHISEFMRTKIPFNELQRPRSLLNCSPLLAHRRASWNPDAWNTTVLKPEVCLLQRQFCAPHRLKVAVVSASLRSSRRPSALWRRTSFAVSSRTAFNPSRIRRVVRRAPFSFACVLRLHEEPFSVSSGKCGDTGSNFLPYSKLLSQNDHGEFDADTGRFNTVSRCSSRVAEWYASRTQAASEHRVFDLSILRVVCLPSQRLACFC